MTVFDEIERRVRKVLETGPTRVMVQNNGNATTPGIAKQQYGVEADVIYIREDNWSLGAPTELAQVAYETWKNTWVLRIETATGEWTLMN